ncbi:hypothetical protein Tco_0818939 [Tanacetum coccineum]
MAFCSVWSQAVIKNSWHWIGYVGIAPEEGGLDEFPAETDKEVKIVIKIVNKSLPLIFNCCPGLPSKDYYGDVPGEK